MSTAPVSAGRISEDRAFWCTPAPALLTALDTSRTGLTQREAEVRMGRFGPNRFDAAHGRPLLTKLTTRLLNPLITILIVAAALSGISGDLGSFLIIVAVISFSLMLDIIQEHRAEQAADALRRSVAVHADVLRDGTSVAVPVSALVPGDIVMLRMGDLRPSRRHRT
jgi:Mg2+-importing ATPase